MVTSRALEEIAFLSRRFSLQLTLRAAMSALTLSVVLLAFLLLTSPLDAGWFERFPSLLPTGEFIQEHEPWDFFIAAFMISTAMGYARQFLDARIDRMNLNKLVAISSTVLDESSEPMETLAIVRAALSARRRLLESLLSLAPAAVQVVVVAIALSLNGLASAAATCIAILLGVIGSVPWMAARFTRRRAALTATQGEEESGRIKDKAARARRAFNRTTGRLRVVVDRPIERLRVGWPVFGITALGGALAAFLIVDGMTRADELPQRSTLLIVFLVISAGGLLRVAQRAEDVAFFATIASRIEEDENQA